VSYGPEMLVLIDEYSFLWEFLFGSTNPENQEFVGSPLRLSALLHHQQGPSMLVTLEQFSHQPGALDGVFAPNSFDNLSFLPYFHLYFFPPNFLLTVTTSKTFTLNNPGQK
jgi:hypothetical protein